MQFTVIYNPRILDKSLRCKLIDRAAEDLRDGDTHKTSGEQDRADLRSDVGKVGKTGFVAGGGWGESIAALAWLRRRLCVCVCALGPQGLMAAVSVNHSC